MGKVDDVRELWSIFVIIVSTYFFSLIMIDISGLQPTNPEDKTIKPNFNRKLVEAGVRFVLYCDLSHFSFSLLLVIASHSGLIGKTPRECNFRSRYGAVIVSVHREGQHIRSKIGSIVLQVGDCLLLQCKQSIPHNEYSQDFLALSELPDENPKRISNYKTWRYWLVLGSSINSLF